MHLAKPVQAFRVLYLMPRFSYPVHVRPWYVESLASTELRGHLWREPDGHSSKPTTYVCVWTESIDPKNANTSRLREPQSVQTSQHKAETSGYLIDRFRRG
jgi:hypothetical protein